MSQPAYIYARYSSMEQSKGNSLKRQLEDGKAFVEREGWLYSETRLLIDKGRSAYSGKNRAPGTALYEFERKAAEGHFLNGIVLAVENIDRLTRQGWEKALDLIRNLTSKGVTVAIWQKPQRVFEAYQKIEMVQVIELVVLSDGARKAQEDKGDRVAKAWETKINAAANGARVAVTKVVPGWIDVDPKTRVMTLNPHRHAVLNDIFDHYIDGKGLPWIERELNGRGEPNWGRGKHGNKPWNVATLHKYLTSRTVLGEYEPKVRLEEDKGRAPRGFVIPDYYPQAITPDKFNRAQAVRGTRKKWSAKKGDSFPNLFSGIATCSECGGRMNMSGYRIAGQPVRHKKRTGGYRVSTVKETRGYLRCANAARKAGCSSPLFLHYQPLEAAVLRYLWDLANRRETIRPNSEAARLTTAVAEQQRLIELKRQQLEQVLDNLMKVSSEALAQRAKDIEDQLKRDEETLKALRQELSREAGKPSPKADLDTLVNARSALDSADPEISYAARVKANQALKNIITGMNCYPDKRTYVHTPLLSFKLDGEGQVIGVVDAINEAQAHRDQLPRNVAEQLEALARSCLVG